MDTEPPRSATGLDDFFHDTSDGTYYFGNADGTWTQASTAPITVVVNQNNQIARICNPCLIKQKT